MSPETAGYLQRLQPLLSMPRETVPQLTVEETRSSLRWAAESLGLELVEIKNIAPTFLLLPPAGRDPDVLLFGTWHAEALPVDPAAVEGAERLALSTTLAGLGRAPEATAAILVAPGATQGSLMLAQALREHRARLRARVAFWPRIAPRAPRRRRVFLGARGRVVLGVWEAGVNPYRIRDRIVEELKGEAYGPRPLDFELLRKLGENRDALDFLEETLEAPGAGTGEGEARLRGALFEPRGQVVKPQVSHPDRPQAWLILDISENADPDELLERARRYAEGSRIEMAEGFPWDRISIHHPSIQAEIKLTKSVSEGPEIWPAAPWLTPSGVFTRALGLPLAEWGVPVHPGVAVRFPKPEDFEALAREVEGLIRGALAEAVERAG
ncbi:MAG TPA: hypothetical protein VEU09_02835 [Candidatus Binatia bacterium]|nr:hypothetical protein [Candidatus Binatia bacterium]